jgi:hypothetical protein
MRLKRPNDAHHFGRGRLCIPFFPGFIGRLAVPKIGARAKELLGAIHPSCSIQFLGSDSSQSGANMRTHQILTAFSMRERQIPHVGVLAFGKIRQQPGIFVVGMGRHIQDPKGLLERLNFLETALGAVWC